MSGLEGLFAIVIVALMPVALVFITRYYALREKELASRSDADCRRLELLAEEKAALELRVENLESIICTADFELERRLLLLDQPRPDSAAARLPAHRRRGARPRIKRRIPAGAAAQKTAT